MSQAFPLVLFVSGPELEKGVSVINDLAVKREDVVFTKDQSGLYMHMDGGLVMCGAEPPKSKTERASHCPDAQAIALDRKSVV